MPLVPRCDLQAPQYQVVLLATRACLEANPDLRLKTKGAGNETALHYACHLLPPTPFEEPQDGQGAVMRCGAGGCASVLRTLDNVVTCAVV